MFLKTLPNVQAKFEAPYTRADEWDLLQRGVRVFAYPQHLQVSSHWPAVTILTSDWLSQPEIVFWNLEATLALFQPVLTLGVLPVFEDINRDKKHTNIFLVSKYFYLSISQQGLPPRLRGYRDGGSRSARQPRA